MKKFLWSILLMTSCNTLPQLYQSVEDVATNNALEIALSKETIDSNKNVTIAIEVFTPPGGR